MNPIKLDTEKLNTHLTIAIKALSVLALATGIYLGTTTFDKVSHSGPSCDKEQFSYWLKQSNSEGVIVSMHENKLQVKDGSTQCYGVFKESGGSFKEWSGVITELDGGNFIGMASLR